MNQRCETAENEVQRLTELLKQNKYSSEKMVEENISLRAQVDYYKEKYPEVFIDQERIDISFLNNLK